MREVIVSEFMTLDGVMEAPDQWSSQFWSEEQATYKYDELFASDALLLGRVTYDEFAAARPSMTEELAIEEIAKVGASAEPGGDMAGYAERMNSLPEYVVSTTLKKADLKLVDTKTFSSGVVTLTYQLVEELDRAES